MKCIVCQREDIRKVDVKEEIKIGKNTVCLPINIPVCATCGERYYDRRTMRYLENEERRLKDENDIISRIEQKWEGYVGFFRKRNKADGKEDARMKLDLISLLEQKWERYAGFFRKSNKVKAETIVMAKAEAEAEAKVKVDAEAVAEAEAMIKMDEKAIAESEAKAEEKTEEKTKVFNWQLTPSDWIRAEAKVKAEEEAKARAKAAAEANKAKIESEKKAKAIMEVDTLSCMVQKNERTGTLQENIGGILSNRS